MCVFFLEFVPKVGPGAQMSAQNQALGPILDPGPNVGPWDQKPRRCGPKNHAEPRLQNSKWSHMVQVMAQNRFEPFGPKPLLRQGDIDPRVAQCARGAYLEFVFSPLPVCPHF